ncbi:hypothetical protein, partial [Pontibacillus litoralis]|uniref:hypothetical protein n=1 Tax=Pontibacillus litoralis TaxID=516703 RepID=UPI0005642396
ESTPSYGDEPKKYNMSSYHIFQNWIFWKSEMVKMSVDKIPEDIKVIIFRSFFSSLLFEDFTSSWDTVLHITIDTKATIRIIFVDTFDLPS